MIFVTCCEGKKEPTCSYETIACSEYSYKINNPLKEGDSFLIRGEFVKNAEGTTIDFLIRDSPEEDVPLRVKADIKQNLVTRSSRQNKEWGAEEKGSLNTYKLAQGKPFMVEILITEAVFKIAVNGFHVDNFKHILCFKDISKLKVCGHVTNIKIEQRFVKEYPQRPKKSSHFEQITDRSFNNMNGQYIPAEEDEFEQLSDTEVPSRTCIGQEYLPLPYYCTFPKGFIQVGYTLTIKAKLRTHSTHFAVILQSGTQIWPNPIYCYRFSCRYTCPECGKLPPPYTQGDHVHDITPESDINLEIVRSETDFVTLLNGNTLMTQEFNSDPNEVNTALILGEIRLYDLEITSPWVVIGEGNRS